MGEPVKPGADLLLGGRLGGGHQQVLHQEPGEDDQDHFDDCTMIIMMITSTLTILMTTATMMIMTTTATLTCRFTADVTCLAVSGDLLAAGSADMILKVGPHPQ